jgi:hypothetical protein
MDAEVFCPFSGDGNCPSEPPCPSQRERVCVNGLPGEEDAEETPAARAWRANIELESMR